MPRLSIWFLRAALVYLAVGITFGALMLANKGVPFYPQLWRLFPMHVEFLLVGWTVQLAMGVAYWILPRFTRGAKRGNVPLAWSAWVMLNAGILMVSLGAWLAASSWLYVGGRVIEGLAAAAFTLNVWSRVRPVG